MSDNAEAPESTPQISPVNDLVNLLITLLTPMFIAAAGGDLRLARLGAQQLLLAYKAHNHADWLTIAQVVALGLATLNTLCLSFVETLPVTLVVRLNNSADRLSRAEARQRKLLAESALKPQAETSLALARTPAPEPQPATVVPAEPKAKSAPQPQAAAELGRSIALLQEAQTLVAACEAMQATQPITATDAASASANPVPDAGDSPAWAASAVRMVEQLLEDSRVISAEEAAAATTGAATLFRPAHELTAQVAAARFDLPLVQPA